MRLGKNGSDGSKNRIRQKDVVEHEALVYGCCPIQDPPEHDVPPKFQFEERFETTVCGLFITTITYNPP